MFPQFNIHSTPLLFLVLQGLIFAALLFFRYLKKNKSYDLLLVVLLFIMAYHRSAYIVGFMGWYDTYPNTKINYYLFSLYLAAGPLVYLYTRTILKTPFKLHLKDLWHFLPVALFITYRMIVLAHDATQEDWATGYEGEWHREIHVNYVAPILQLLEYSSILLYLAFTIQMFVQYKKRIKSFFSNTYKLELNWIQLFLSIYCFLFIYNTVAQLMDAFISDLNYIHFWWVHFLSSVAIVFLGIKSYITNLDRLHEMTYNIPPLASGQTISMTVSNKKKEKVVQHIEISKSFLKPNFTLKELAEELDMSLHEVSEIINNGFGINFNEFINQYRVEEVKAKLKDPSQDHFSLIAIAQDSGFNSKASFNRIFKQVTGQSPSEYKKDSRV